MSVYDVGDLIFNEYGKTGRLSCDGSAVRKGTYPDLANISVDFQYEPLFPSIIPGTPEMPGTGYSVSVDDDFIYLAGNSYIAKVRRSDWTIVDEVLELGGTVQGIAVDETHIYAVGGGSPNFHKIRKTDLSFETHNLSFSNPRVLYVEDSLIHVGHFRNAQYQSYTVYDKDTLAMVGGVEIPGIPRAIIPYKGFVYIGNPQDYCVYVIDKEDWSVVSTSQSMPGAIQDLIVEEDFIYVAHGISPGLTVLNRSDLSVAHILDVGGMGYSVYVDDFHIYLGRGAVGEIHIFKKSEWSHVVGIPIEGNNINDIYVDEEYIFAAHGGGESNFTALSKRDTVAEGFFRVPEITRNPKYPNIPVLVQAYDKWPPWPRDLLVKGQSLVYDFVNQVYVVSHQDNTIDYTSNVNDLGIVTRASTATYWGPDGTLLEAAVDKARIQHDPVTGEPLGVLIEPSRTNNYARTTDPNWLRCDPVEFIQHDRFIDAYKVTAPVDERSGAHRFTWNDSTLFPSDGTIFSFSITVKRLTDNIREVWLGQRGSSYFPGATSRSIFSFEDETFTSETSNSKPGIVEYLGDGYYRITRIGVFHYHGIGIAFTDQNGNVDFSNDEVRELIIADIQVEAGTYPTSYIPTTGSPVTRAEDYFGLNMGDKASSTGGTFRVTAQVPEGELVMLISSQASGFLTLYSDSDETKTYTLSHPEDVVAFALGYGIHQSLEYFPEAQS